MEISVRELRAKLSEYLAAAADGADVVVTDRGRPIVRLVPIDERSPFERGIEEGWIRPPTGDFPQRIPRFQSARSVMEVLDEDRG